MQIKPRGAFGLSYLMIELFYIGVPVVRTDGRRADVRSRDYQNFSDAQVTKFSYPWCSAERVCQHSKKNKNALSRVSLACLEINFIVSWCSYATFFV